MCGHCFPHLRVTLDPSISLFFPAEATSCRAAIRMAQGVVSDVGSAAKRSAGMLELARCTLTNSEREFQRVVRKFHLALEIPLTILPKTPGVIYPGQIAALSLNDWLRFLIDKQLWCMLVGLHRSNPDRERQILRTFWQRFKQIEPHHRVFQLAESGEISLETCCPVLLHGDEGRGRKKSGFL